MRCRPHPERKLASGTGRPRIRPSRQGGTGPYAYTEGATSRRTRVNSRRSACPREKGDGCDDIGGIWLTGVRAGDREAAGLDHTHGERVEHLRRLEGASPSVVVSWWPSSVSSVSRVATTGSAGGLERGGGRHCRCRRRDRRGRCGWVVARRAAAEQHGDDGGPVNPAKHRARRGMKRSLRSTRRTVHDAAHSMLVPLPLGDRAGGVLLPAVHHRDVLAHHPLVLVTEDVAVVHVRAGRVGMVGEADRDRGR